MGISLYIELVEILQFFDFVKFEISAESAGLCYSSSFINLVRSSVMNSLETVVYMNVNKLLTDFLGHINYYNISYIPDTYLLLWGKTLKISQCPPGLNGNLQTYRYTFRGIQFPLELKQNMVSINIVQYVSTKLYERQVKFKESMFHR